MDRKDLTDISKCYLIQCQLPPMLSNALVAGDSGGISLRSQKSELCFALASDSGQKCGPTSSPANNK